MSRHGRNLPCLTASPPPRAVDEVNKAIIEKQEQLAAQNAPQPSTPGLKEPQDLLLMRRSSSQMSGLNVPMGSKPQGGVGQIQTPTFQQLASSTSPMSQAPQGQQALTPSQMIEKINVQCHQIQVQFEKQHQELKQLQETYQNVKEQLHQHMMKESEVSPKIELQKQLIQQQQQLIQQQQMIQQQQQHLNAEGVASSQLPSDPQSQSATRLQELQQNYQILQSSLSKIQSQKSQLQQDITTFEQEIRLKQQLLQNLRASQQQLTQQLNQHQQMMAPYSQDRDPAWIRWTIKVLNDEHSDNTMSIIRFWQIFIKNNEVYYIYRKNFIQYMITSMQILIQPQNLMANHLLSKKIAWDLAYLFIEWKYRELKDALKDAPEKAKAKIWKTIQNKINERTSRIRQLQSKIQEIKDMTPAVIEAMAREQLLIIMQQKSAEQPAHKEHMEIEGPRTAADTKSQLAQQQPPSGGSPVKVEGEQPQQPQQQQPQQPQQPQPQVKVEDAAQD